MSWFRSKNTTQKPDFTALQINTAASTLPIPIVYGVNKIAGNLVWYQNFYALAGRGSGKGGGGKGGGGGGSSAATASYTYYADLIIALCEGPINGINNVWKDQSISSLGLLGLGLGSGSVGQPVWGYLTSFYPSQAIGYSGVAFLPGASFNLGSSATIGNCTFEVEGFFSASGVNNFDADPALVIYDFLTNPQYGCGFSPSSIDTSTLYRGSGSSLGDFAWASGIAFSPAISSQEQASSILARWLQILQVGAVWSAGKLRFIPYGDTAVLEGSLTTYQWSVSIPRLEPVSANLPFPGRITVCGPAQFAGDGGVIFQNNGFPLVFIGAMIPVVSGTYGMITPGEYIFAYADSDKPVTLTFTYAAAGSYSPSLAAVYTLTDDDFIYEDGKDPVQVERSDVFSLPTVQRVEVLSRSNRYAAVPCEARDQGQIETYGARVGTVIQAHEVCDEFVMGPRIAQMILQRELYLRSKFTFRLSWEYCLLDPMDIVAITDTALGLQNALVRVAGIDEDDNGLLTITAEELVIGISSPNVNPSATNVATSKNWAVPAVAVNNPLIYEPPPAATGGIAQVWVGCSAAPLNPTQWGGANVWLSIDDETYDQVAQITAPLREGVLTAPMPAVAGWDTTSTLLVDLTMSAAAISGTSQSAAQQGATLSLVGSELISYQSAILTAPNNYAVTGMQRGLGGTPASVHVAGELFARLDGAVVKYDLPPNMINKTVYLKFQSFNVYGAGIQDLSTCEVYSFTPTGVGGPAPIIAQLESGLPVDFGNASDTPVVIDDLGPASGAILYAADNGFMTTPQPIISQLRAGTPVDLGSVTNAATVSDDLGQSIDPETDIISLGTAP